MSFKSKKQSPKGRLIQLVFDFFTPVSVQQRGSLVAEPVKINPEPRIQINANPSTQSDRVLAPASLFIHPCSTHALDIKGIEIHYLLSRTKRKTIGMLVSQEGLEVRAPRWVSLSQVQMALQDRGDWLFKQFDFMAQKLEQSKHSEIELESGCVGAVLGQGVQWMFHGLKVESPSGDSSPEQERGSRLQRENQKRLRLPLEHIELQKMEDGQWLECTLSEWIELLLERAPHSKAKASATGRMDANDALYRVYLPIAPLFKLLSEGKIGGAAHSPGWASADLAKACAKQWIDAVQIHLAQFVLHKRVAYFSSVLGVKPSAITLGQAKSRWGSAGSNGAIRLNWHLVNLPMALLDYVVAHEVCHLKQMNHGPEFWAEMKNVMPDFAQRRQHLKSLTMAKWI